MFIGSGDQTSILLDVGPSSVTPVATFRGHSASIKTVDFSPNNNCKSHFFNFNFFFNYFTLIFMSKQFFNTFSYLCIRV